MYTQLRDWKREIKASIDVGIYWPLIRYRGQCLLVPVDALLLEQIGNGAYFAKHLHHAGFLPLLPLRWWTRCVHSTGNVNQHVTAKHSNVN